MANNNEYFLIIADLAMPSMNRFEFTRKIRSTSPDIKVVLMTASKLFLR
jgi:CheY-like chemotaxis protein